MCGTVEVPAVLEPLVYRVSLNGLTSEFATFGIVGAHRELCVGHGAAFSARRGTKSEDSNPSGWRPKLGATGGRVAAHPAAPVQRQALPTKTALTCRICW